MAAAITAATMLGPGELTAVSAALPVAATAMAMAAAQERPSETVGGSPVAIETVAAGVGGTGDPERVTPDRAKLSRP